MAPFRLADVGAGPDQVPAQICTYVPSYLSHFDVGPFLQGAFRVNARCHDYMSRLVKLLWNVLEYVWAMQEGTAFLRRTFCLLCIAFTYSVMPLQLARN